MSLRRSPSGKAYPNPFNPTTTICHSVATEGPVTIDVFDSVGRLVKNVVRSVQAKGTHQVRFDGTDLPSGVYVYRITTPDEVLVGKLLLLK